MFTGEGNGRFRAYDAKNGKVLWTFHAGAGVNAPPSSYASAASNTSSVAAGGNVQLDSKRGNAIIAFTADESKPAEHRFSKDGASWPRLFLRDDGNEQERLRRRFAGCS